MLIVKSNVAPRRQNIWYNHFTAYDCCQRCQKEYHIPQLHFYWKYWGASGHCVWSLMFIDLRMKKLQWKNNSLPIIKCVVALHTSVRSFYYLIQVDNSYATYCSGCFKLALTSFLHILYFGVYRGLHSILKSHSILWVFFHLKSRLVRYQYAKKWKKNSFAIFKTCFNI